MPSSISLTSRLRILQHMDGNQAVSALIAGLIYLYRPDKSVTLEMLDIAHKERVERSGVAFRIQIINGRLFVEDIRALWYAGLGRRPST